MMNALELENLDGFQALESVFFLLFMGFKFGSWIKVTFFN